MPESAKHLNPPGRSEQLMLFSTAYSRLLAHELGLEELDWPHLLTGTALSPGLLRDGDAFISLPEQKRIIANALVMAPEPGLGLRLGSKLHLIAHGPLGVAASSAPDIEAGLDVMMRFQATRAQFVTLALLRQPQLHMRLIPHLQMDEVGIFLMEAMAASVRCATESLLGQSGVLKRFEFSYPPPPHAAIYAQTLMAECHFNRPHIAIPFPADLLQKRSLFADPELHRQSLQQCLRIEQEIKQQQCLSDQIRKRIRQQQFRCTLEDIAGQFNMCPRTLIRRLKRENTAFRDIFEQELQSATVEYLQDASLPVDAVAQLLGYQQTVNFRRACQRWFAMTPSELRQQIHTGRVHKILPDH